jgi:hypothetical protein
MFLGCWHFRFVPQADSRCSFDHLVGAKQQRLWNGEVRSRVFAVLSKTRVSAYCARGRTSDRATARSQSGIPYRRPSFSSLGPACSARFLSDASRPTSRRGRAAPQARPASLGHGRRAEPDILKCCCMSIGKLQPFLEEFDLIPVGIGDINGQAIHAIVQLIEEFDLCSLKALSDGPHTRHAERHVVDL